MGDNIQLEGLPVLFKKKSKSEVESQQNVVDKPLGLPVLFKKKVISDFDTAVNHILKSEGGYVNDPDDPGGETNFGISSVYNPDIDVANLTIDDAKQIYKDRYWDAIEADTLPGDIRMQMFDTAVNMGVGTANRLLQESEGDPNKFLELRKQEYRRIADERPTSQKYLNGWINRADQAASISGIAPEQKKSRTLFEKETFQDDPVIEDLKSKDDVTAWTSAYSLAKYKVYQDNADTDIANQKIQGLDEKEKLIKEKQKQEIQSLKEQHKMDFDALNNDYKTKSEKINEKYSKALPKAKTKTEYETLKSEYKQALENEYQNYTTKYKEKELKYQQQIQKLSESFDKDTEQFNKDIEGLNKELEAQNKQSKIKTRFLTDKASSNIQKLIQNAPKDYNGKKEFIKKQVSEAVDDYIYAGGLDVDAFKEELYAVINEKLLIDEDGKPTIYAIKNQAELAKKALSKQWDEYNSKVAQQLSGKYDPFELQDERDRLIKTTENLDVVLEMPEGTEEKKKGNFFGGWSSQKGWIDRAMGMGILTRGADIQFSKVAKKSQEGISLNPTEQALIDSEALLATATEKMSPEFSAMYKAGQAIGGSIEWLTSMASTSGLYSKVFKGVLKGLGYKVGGKIISGNLPKYVAAEVAGALSRIPLQAPFYVDIMTRRAGITPEVGKYEGSIKGEAYVPKESFTKSVVTSTYSKFAENLSEMAGKYIDYGLKVGKGKLIEQLAKKFNLGALSRVAKSKASQSFNQVATRFGIGQPFGEFSEEKIAEVLHWVDGSTKPKDFFDAQQNWVTFLSVATMVAPFQVVKAFGKTKGELKTTDFLSKDQVSDLNKITSLKDIEVKAKKLGRFILDNNLEENFEQQEAVAKHVWDSQQEMVANEMATAETAVEKPESADRYSHGDFEVSREVAKEAIENAETIKELEQIGIAPNDTELKKQATAKANALNLLKEEEARFNKEIEEAGLSDLALEKAQKEHQKRKALILSGKQVPETVKEEKAEKETEIKTEISETQPTKILTEQPKVETVKPKNWESLTTEQKWEASQKAAKAGLSAKELDELFPFSDEEMHEIAKKIYPEYYPKEQPLSKVAKDMKAQFDKFSKQAKNALPHVIVDSIDQLPKEVKDRMGKLSEGAKVQAFVDPKTNTIYFIAKNIPKDKVLAKWVHEQGIHRGLEVLIPKKADRDKLLKKVFDSVGIDKIRASLPKVYSIKHESGKLSNEGIAEEYMAQLAEKIIKEEDLTPEENSVWQKIKEYIEKIIRKTYGKAKLTDKEIAEVIQASVKSIYSEEKAKPKQSIQNFIEQNKTEIFSQLKANGIIKVKGEC